MRKWLAGAALAVSLLSARPSLAQTPSWYAQSVLPKIWPVQTYYVCALHEYRIYQRRPERITKERLNNYLRAVLMYDDWTHKQALPRQIRIAIEEEVRR